MTSSSIQKNEHAIMKSIPGEQRIYRSGKSGKRFGGLRKFCTQRTCRIDQFCKRGILPRCSITLLSGQEKMKTRFWSTTSLLLLFTLGLPAFSAAQTTSEDYRVRDPFQEMRAPVIGERIPASTLLAQGDSLPNNEAAEVESLPPSEISLPKVAPDAFRSLFAKTSVATSTSGMENSPSDQPAEIDPGQPQVVSEGVWHVQEEVMPSYAPSNFVFSSAAQKRNYLGGTFDSLPNPECACDEWNGFCNCGQCGNDLGLDIFHRAGRCAHGSRNCNGCSTCGTGSGGADRWAARGILRPSIQD
jgi:hypothetical protein